MARPETGVMKFSGDWTGIFIRGDDAFVFSSFLNDLSKNQTIDKFEAKVINDLRDILASCREPVSDPLSVQHLRSFEECRNGD